MNFQNLETQKRLKIFEKVCRTSRKKQTLQRREIFKALAQAENHPDAETLHKNLSKRFPTLSLDTVYRTLWWLRDLGCLETLGSSHEKTRFDPNPELHHHFVCRDCGAIKDFEDRKFNQLKPPAGVETMGVWESLRVEIRGLCQVCVGKKRKQKRKRRNK